MIRKERYETTLRLVDAETPDSGTHKLQGALCALFVRFNRQAQSIKPGMLVEWKPGLSNRRTPAYGEPVVAVEVLKKPVFDDSFKSGSPYYREPMDLLVGSLDEDGDFVVFHVDSRRFRRYREVAS